LVLILPLRPDVWPNPFVASGRSTDAPERESDSPWQERNCPPRRVIMVWFIVIIALVVITVGFVEWRLWNKPQPNSLQNGGDPYRFRYSSKPCTGENNVFDQHHAGGRDFDQRHD